MCSRIAVLREYMYEGRMYVLVEVTLPDGSSGQAWSCGEHTADATESAAAAAIRVLRMVVSAAASGVSSELADDGRQSVGPTCLTPGKRLRVLVVDDDRACLAVLTKALEGFCDVVSGTDGREILDKIVRNEEVFDLVFIDERMRHIGGCEALTGMRDFEKTAGREKTPAVIVSAANRDEDIVRFRQADAQAFLAKPVKAANLRREVEELLTLVKNGNMSHLRSRGSQKESVLRSGDCIGDMLVL